MNDLNTVVYESVTAWVQSQTEPIMTRLSLHGQRLGMAERRLLELGESRATGEHGPPGPVGPMPAHEWEGTKLRFELAPGQWGSYVDLQGPPGTDARTVLGLPVHGGGSATTSANSYWPAGW